MTVYISQVHFHPRQSFFKPNEGVPNCILHLLRKRIIHVDVVITIDLYLHMFSACHRECVVLVLDQSALLLFNGRPDIHAIDAAAAICYIEGPLQRPINR